MTTLLQRTPSDRGVAMILALFLVLAVSIIGSSIMFLGQTETHAGNNYRLMSQTRYAAESGVQTAVNFLLYSYAAPIPGGADNLSSYNYSGVSPVTWNGQPVVLSANNGVPSNYPVGTVQQAFAQAAGGTLTTGPTTITYGPYARLLSMQQINEYGVGMVTIQTWEIVSDGTVNTGGKTAQVEVSAVLETQVTPATNLYAAFSTGAGCGAMLFGGNSHVDSYNSAALSGGSPVISNSGGNIGTNGNLGESGNAAIYGTLSSPRVGVGACSAGNVDAVTSSGHASICPNPSQACSGIQTGGVLSLPQQVVMQTPIIGNPQPPTTTYTGASTLHGGDAAGNISVAANSTLTLGDDGVTTTQIIKINSLNLGANSRVVIKGQVILQIAGQGTTSPLSLGGGAISNPGFDPSNFQIQYGGNQPISFGGNSDMTAMIYAPNAPATLGGNAGFYGSIVTSSLNVTGNASIHYDRHLSSEFVSAGNTMLSAFSWRKY